MITPKATRQSPSAAKGNFVVVLALLMALCTSTAVEQPNPDEIAKALQGTWDILCLEDGDHARIEFGEKFHYGKTKWFDPGSVTLENGSIVFDKGMTFDVGSGVKNELTGQWRGRPRKMTRLGTKAIEVKPSVAATPIPVQAPSNSVTQAPPEQTLSPIIKLRKGWDSPMQGGSKTHRDLVFVLDRFGKADANPAFDDIEIYSGVKYLMPLKDALAVLKLDQRIPSTKEVMCAGFPRGSLSYVSFDGLFDGHYNRMDLVVDSANQVVCIQFVDEAPRGRSSLQNEKTGEWLTYNFVGFRVKAMTNMKVDYSMEDLHQWSEKRGKQLVPINQWEFMGASNSGKVALRRVSTVLRDKERKPKEETRWYVPRPLADLILYCISKSQQ